jgi:hypothetical protein
MTEMTAVGIGGDSALDSDSTGAGVLPTTMGPGQSGLEGSDGSSSYSYGTAATAATPRPTERLVAESD